jgi:transcriptional regulator with XRE-family HTH domain
MRKKLLVLIGERIRDIRADRKISQEELAWRVQLSIPYISQVENGRRNISAINLDKIAKALGAEVGDFFPPTDKT